MGGSYLLHCIIYRLFWLPVCLIELLKRRYHRGKQPRLEGPSLIVCNHNTDVDPLLVALSFHRHTYFVASEHVYRHGFVSKLLYVAFAPIARMKGSTDSASAMMILKALHKGHNVCIFAEGNRSFNGLTGEVHPTIGKLARTAKANLVIYRLEGGYLTTPRWALHPRRGKMRMVLRQVYTPEQLRAMTPAQIHEAVRQGIGEDAYRRQDEQHIAYRGKRLAEGLECALYLCPKCGGIQTISSEGNTFRCISCGLEGNYTVYGYLEGESIPYRTVTAWDLWQREKLREIVENAGDGVLFTDGDCTLTQLNAERRTEKTVTGTLSLSASTLRVGETAIPMETITDMAMFARQNLAFTAGDTVYEIRIGGRTSGRKYLHAYGILSGKPLGV